jgi:glycosyltransferase involved in cell wall biosynthesis
MFRPKLIFLVTEDWYFWSHRLPVARAARAAGYEVLVATRVRDHGERIAGEGFRLCPLRWRRSGDGLGGGMRALIEVAALYRRERPDIVHHVALKPVVFGGAALRLAFPRRTRRPLAVAAVAGLGSGLGSALGRRLMQVALRLVLRHGRVIVQNPEDGVAIAGLGIDPARIELIRGSGVDLDQFAAMPDPETGPVSVALVSRMLRSKGVPEAAAAIRTLRADGLDIELLLAGPGDPDNQDSLGDDELTALAAEPGVNWLGPVGDVPGLWRRAAIAVLPSTYGEGVPKALIEAAACARPIVTTDMPGCREIVRHGETGLLVPPGDNRALAEAIRTLALDPARRRMMGLAGRVWVEQAFSDRAVVRQTLAVYRTLLANREIAG